MEERDMEMDVLNGNGIGIENELSIRDEEKGLDLEGILTQSGNVNGRWRRKWRIFCTWSWIFFSAYSILTTRRVLTTSFPYPICFLVLLQITAYFGLSIFAVLTSLVDYFTDIPDPNPNPGPSFCQAIFILYRYCLTVAISMTALIYSAKAIMHFQNLAVYSTLLILTYAFDAILFSLAYDLRLLPRDQGFDRSIALWAFGICILAATIIYNDYRLNMEGLWFAILGMFLVSFARIIGAIGYQVPKPKNPAYGRSLYFMLWGGLPPCLFVTIYAACKYEDYEKAFWISRTWDLGTVLANLGPGAITHVFWNTPLRSTLALSTKEGSPYEANGENVPDAIDATLHLSLGLLLMSTLIEENAMDGFQIFIFLLIYTVSIGPKEISLYLPRLINFMHTIRRKASVPERKLYRIWHKPILLWTTTLAFTILSSFGISYWINTISIHHDAKFWKGPTTPWPYLDSTYRSPTKSRLEIVIAHSSGDPITNVQKVLDGIFGSQPKINALTPQITIYTKQANLPTSTVDILERFHNLLGPLRVIIPRPNIGGVTETYIYHILKSWDILPSQTLFLSASNETIRNLGGVIERLYEYYDPVANAPGSELMVERTGFLNLGVGATCDCYGCRDGWGWEDTFGLVPSMFAATRPVLKEGGGEGKGKDMGKDMQKKGGGKKLKEEIRCKKVVLTYGNNFLASAQRLRGVERGIWDMFGEALSNPSLEQGWAHDRYRLGVEGRETRLNGMGGRPVGRVWRGGMGDTGGMGDGADIGRERELEMEIWGEKDSLEKPHLGYVMERIWGVMLGCSSQEVAWRCPALGRGVRRGGGKGDCACVD